LGSTIEPRKTLSLATIQSSGHFESHFENAKPTNTYEFDYLNKTWKKNVYSYEKYNEILPFFQTDELKSKIKEFPNYIGQGEKKFTKERFNISHELNKQMLSLFIDTLSISTETYGYINRWAGDIIGLYTSDKNNPLSMNGYDGFWMAFKVVHKWGISDYSNNIFMSRIDRPKNQLRNQ